MQEYLSIPAILILWVLVHLDWHLARSHHRRLSMEWHQLGSSASSLFPSSFVCAWKWPERFVSAAFLNAIVGLFVRHIGEAGLEALRGHESLGAVPTAERGHAFFALSLAGLAGLLLGMLVVFSERSWRGKS